jgi:hypothetical protein
VAGIVRRVEHQPLLHSRRTPQTIYDWRSYLTVVQLKPGTLRNGAPFVELPSAFRQLQDHMLRKQNGDRERGMAAHEAVERVPTIAWNAQAGF